MRYVKRSIRSPRHLKPDSDKLIKKIFFLNKTSSNKNVTSPERAYEIVGF